MPSAGIRFAGEAAFLVLVALGLGLAQFDAIVIAVVMLCAWVLVALLERASAKEAARAAEKTTEEPLSMPPPHVERIDVEPTPAQPVAEEPQPEPAPQAKPEPEPKLEPAVNERSARAILASAPPPQPPEPPKPKPARRRRVERRPDPPRAAPPPATPPPPPPPPEREPEAVSVAAGPPREWNLWELQRAVRDAPDEERREEWNALLMHLREFANADGDLPLEFDGLVRESFAVVLVPGREPAAAS